MTKNYLNCFRSGNKILEVGYDGNERFLRKSPYQPTMFIDAKRGETESKWVLLDGTPVYPVKPGSIGDCRDFMERYKEVSGISVYGNTNWEYAYIADNYPGECHLDIEMLRIFFLDIETKTNEGFPSIETANEEISLLSIYDSRHKRFHVFSAKDFTLPDDSKYSNIVKSIHRDEYHMLKEFVIFWTQQCPDIVTGWNSNSFDLPYIIRRITKVLGEELAAKLSPWGIIKERRVVIKGNETILYDIAGVSCIDYLDIYKKYSTSGTKESYKLDFIAEYELGTKKLDYSEFPTFKAFYEGAWDKFCLYNIIDTELVVLLEDKLRLIELVCTVAYEAKINFEDVSSPIRTWDNVCTNYLMERHIVPPNQKFGSKNEQFEGAFVKDVTIGRHKNVAAFDLDSLYPNLAILLNMGPETLVPYVQDSPRVNVELLLERSVDLGFLLNMNLAMGANGAYFKRDKQSFISAILEAKYAKRKLAKKQMITLMKEVEELESYLKTI